MVYLTIVVTIVSWLISPTLQGCISLTGSTACPELEGFSIDLGHTTLRNQYPNLDAIDNFLNGNSQIEDIKPSCKAWSDNKQQVRFAKTLRCVTLVATSRDCNRRNDNKTVSLCRDSCNTFADSYDMVGKQVCSSNTTGVDKMVENYKKVCESFPTNNCISAEKNEEIGCGKLLY
jgi:hypothetical protein